MALKSTFRGRVLSEDDLKWIRREIECLDGIDVIDDELRELIESQWPDPVVKLPPQTLH